MIEQETGGFGFAAGRWPLDGTKSTLLFIHGTASSAAFWQRQIDGLAGHANTVAVDLPGHGRSQAAGRDLMADYARSVIEFVDAAGLEDPIPCGISMGGAVAQQLLLDYPGRFPAGILICTGAKLKIMPAIYEIVQKDYPGFVAMMGQWGPSSKTAARQIQPFLDDVARCRPMVTLGDFRACDNFNVMDRLAEIQVPVLVVTAEDDRLTAPKYGEFLEKNIPNASRVHIADAGHIVSMEQPAKVNQAIVEFLNRIGL
jgi:pimeloyl-ACP methyl ester carboxylesterase